MCWEFLEAPESMQFCTQTSESRRYRVLEKKKLTKLLVRNLQGKTARKTNTQKNGGHPHISGEYLPFKKYPANLETVAVFLFVCLFFKCSVPNTKVTGHINKDGNLK